VRGTDFAGSAGSGLEGAFAIPNRGVGYTRKSPPAYLLWDEPKESTSGTHLGTLALELRGRAEALPQLSIHVVVTILVPAAITFEGVV
jgi:hypothetical protein